MPGKNLLDDLEPRGEPEGLEEVEGKGKGQKGKGKDAKGQEAKGKGKKRGSAMTVLLLILVLGIIVSAGTFFLVSANPQAKAAVAKLPVIGKFFGPKETPVDPLEAARQQLAKDQEAVAAREAAVQEAQAALDAKAKELADREKALAEKEKAVAQLQAELENRKEVVDKLARLYNLMKPVEVAAVAERLDDELLVSILGRMEEQQAAKVLAAMPPATSARLTRMIAAGGK